MLEKIKNLLSRKFLATVAGNVGTILIAVGVDNDIAKIVSCLLLIVINAVYVITEGSIDKADLVNWAEKFSDFVDGIADEELDEKTDEIVEGGTITGTTIDTNETK